MNRDDSQQILEQNGLQQTCMLEAEMIHRDKYGAIQERFERGVPKKAIARALGIHVKALRKYLKRGRWVPYQREPAVGKVLSGFEDWIKAGRRRWAITPRFCFRRPGCMRIPGRKRPAFRCESGHRSGAIRPVNEVVVAG